MAQHEVGEDEEPDGDDGESDSGSADDGDFATYLEVG